MVLIKQLVNIHMLLTLFKHSFLCSKHMSMSTPINHLKFYEKDTILGPTVPEHFE